MLSLVVVPARAADDTAGAAGGIQITASAQKAVQGDKVTFTASNPTITYQGTTYSGSDVHATYKWDNNDQKTAATYEVTAASSNITAHLTAVLTYTIPSGTEGVAGTTIQATVDKSCTVTVITKQAKANEDFAKALSFTYNSRPCTKTRMVRLPLIVSMAKTPLHGMQLRQVILSLILPPLLGASCL